MRKFLLILFAILSASATTNAAVAADTVYVMRHLQKADGTDPPLSQLGASNAQALSERLGEKGIKAIFATATKRAMQTGQALAGKLKISITNYDPRDPAALIAAVSQVNGSVLVVGHSNTVPDLVTAFGGTRPEALTEQDYGTIFIVKPGSSDVQRIELSEAAK